MATLDQVSAQPFANLNHIDALLASGPGWNWFAPTRTTLYYTFALSGDYSVDAGKISGPVSAFNAAQQAAVVAALNDLAAITGITFTATADESAADLHFGATNVTGAGVTGLCSWNVSYSFSGNTVTNYTADARIYLDNAEFAGTTGSPSVGSAGYQILLHEIGHAMGLKHPFEGAVTLPAAQDNTAYTLESYTAVGGPYSSYRPYDIAALMWLYGGDGLGGQLGHSTTGRYTVGTDLADTLLGGAGNDVFDGGSGNDQLTGGSGSDTARFSGNRALYTITAVAGGFQVSGPDGTDTLTGIERARFADQLVQLQAGGNTPPTGALGITGVAAQGTALSITSTLADADGLGALSYRWQASSNGTSWTDIAAAVAASFTPGEAQVGKLLRVLGSYVDGQGNAEAVTSAATAAVANLNDAPSGIVLVSGNAQQGHVLSATNNIMDADGLGLVSYRWQSSANGGAWADIAGASGATLTPAEAQVGLNVRAVASYGDGHGTAESVASQATAAVLNTNDPPTGAVAINGLAEQGASLAATAALADLDGLGAIALEWQVSANGSSWAAISGATQASFVLGAAQVGQLVRVLARYTDGHGSAEAVASAASANVLGVLTGSAAADQLEGTAFADRLSGLAGNDRLAGHGGADVLDGGLGVDTAVFERVRADYVVGAGGTSVRALSGGEGSDTLVSIERLKFSDRGLAFDLNGAAGITARILGAVFGRDAVGNQLYAGIGLAELDAGRSRDALVQLALDVRLGVGFTVADEVRLLYRNLANVDPSNDELNFWTNQVKAGVYDTATLAWYAASLALNANQINLVGLAESGLGFI